MNKLNKFCRLLKNGKYDKIFNSPEYSYLLLKLGNNIPEKDRQKALDCIFKSPRFSLLFLKEAQFNNSEKLRAVEIISKFPRMSHLCLYYVGDLNIQERELLIDSVIKESYSCLLTLQMCKVTKEEKKKLITSIVELKSTRDITSLIKTIKLSKYEFDQCLNVIINDISSLMLFIYDMNNLLINNLSSKHMTKITNEIVKFNSLNLATYLLQNYKLNLLKDDIDKLNSIIVFHKLSEEN